MGKNFTTRPLNRFWKKKEFTIFPHTGTPKPPSWSVSIVHLRNACTVISLPPTRSDTKIYYSSWYVDTMPVNIAASEWPQRRDFEKLTSSVEVSTDED